jgi:predicted ribosome quality control (RQC) complex YloA/Tae2 family protein
LLSAHPEQARVLLTSKRLDADPQRVSPLLLLLRKYARGGRIVGIAQPSYERIIQISIAKPLDTTNHDDEGNEAPDVPPTFTDLYIELMGRRSNIILANADGQIMDAIKRVTPEMSRVRPIRPHLRYSPPPPLTKADPLHVSVDSLLALAQDTKPEPVTRWLVATFLGVSPLLAREVVFRADVDEQTRIEELDRQAAERLANGLRSVFSPLQTSEWQPMLYQWESDRADFSSIRLQSLEKTGEAPATPYDSVFAAAEAAFEVGVATVSTAPQRHAARREMLVAEIDVARDRVTHRLQSIAEQAERALEIEHWREMGEAIYIWIADISPGQRELTTPEGLVITLDPALSPSQNAQEYFERYRKAQSAEENLPQLRDAAQQQLDYLDQLRALADIAETYDEIESVRLEWIAWADETAGHKATRAKGARPSKQARRPRSYRNRFGDTIFVGRTGQQNDTVTFDIAGPTDLWLHVRGMPGAHVILRANGDPADNAIEQAAALADWNSNGRTSTTVPVDVTERRYVRKIKGSGPGMVTYRNERTLNVRPQSEKELGLE